VFAGVRDEPGRERVEEWRESTVEARGESAGEGGAGRDELMNESRDWRNELREGGLGLSSEGFAESSVVVVGMKEEGVADVEHHRSAVCGIWELWPGGGVEGETGVPPASSSADDLSSRISSCDGWLAVGASDPALLTVGVVWPFRVVLESGLSGSTWENEAGEQLALLLPLVMVSALSLRLSRVGCAFVIVLDVLPANAVAVVTPSGWVDAADS